MKKILFMLIGILLMSCNAKDSNVAKSISENKEIADTMTTEEKALAEKIGALKVEKLAEDTFKVTKLLPVQAYKKIMGIEYMENEPDSIPMVGAVDSKGRWYVRPVYEDIFCIAKDAFVGELHFNYYDQNPDNSAYTVMRQVVYRGKPIGNFTHDCDITPVEYRGKLVGFLKAVYNSELNTKLYYYINTKGKGWDSWIGQDIGFYPKFEYCKISGKTLTLWGGAEKLEDIEGFPPEDRSLYKVDLQSGKVLANTFVLAN